MEEKRARSYRTRRAQGYARCSQAYGPLCRGGLNALRGKADSQVAMQIRSLRYPGNLTGLVRALRGLRCIRERGVSLTGLKQLGAQPYGVCGVWFSLTGLRNVCTGLMGLVRLVRHPYGVVRCIESSCFTEQKKTFRSWARQEDLRAFKDLPGLEKCGDGKELLRPGYRLVLRWLVLPSRPAPAEPLRPSA